MEELFIPKSQPTHHLVFITLSLILASNLLPLHPHKLPFILLWILSIFYLRIRFSILLLIAFLSSVLITIQTLLNQLNHPDNKTYLNHLNTIFSPNKWILNFLSTHYSPKVSSTIGLLVFNSKSSHLYQTFRNMGIPYLLSVSGLHFIIAHQLLIRILPSRKLTLPILLLYWSSIDYSIPGLRVILGMLISHKYEGLHKWSLTALLILPFNLRIFRSLSFLLSYSFSFLFALNRQTFSRTWKFWPCSYISAFLMSTLIFLHFKPHTIHLTAIPFSLIFAPIVSLLFGFFFFTWWCTFLDPIHVFASDWIFSLSNRINELNINHTFSYWDLNLSSFSLFLFGIWVLFLWRRTVKI